MFLASVIANVVMAFIIVIGAWLLIIQRIDLLECREAADIFSRQAADWRFAYDSECEAHLQTKEDSAELRKKLATPDESWAAEGERVGTINSGEFHGGRLSGICAGCDERDKPRHGSED